MTTYVNVIESRNLITWLLDAVLDVYMILKVDLRAPYTMHACNVEREG